MEWISVVVIDKETGKVLTKWDVNDVAFERDDFETRESVQVKVYDADGWERF